MLDHGNAADEVQAAAEDAPGTSVVPAEQSEAAPAIAWHTLSPAAIKERAKGLTAPRALKNWESDYALVMAACGGWKKVPEKDRIAIASAYARGRVHRKELQGLHKRPAFTKLLRKYMGEMPDDALEEYRARAIELIPEALEVQAEAIRVLKRELHDGKDKLGAVRAAPPLLNPFIERALPPKRGEGANIATNITITLSTHQAAKLDAPVLHVAAEDVPYEVVAEEIVPIQAVS